MLARNRRRMVEEAAASPVSGGGSYPARPAPALPAIPDGAPPFPCVSASPRANGLPRGRAARRPAVPRRLRRPQRGHLWGRRRQVAPSGRPGALVACNGEGETGAQELRVGRGAVESGCPTAGGSPVSRGGRLFYQAFPLLRTLASGAQPLSLESWPTVPIGGKCPGLGVGGEAAGAFAPPGPHGTVVPQDPPPAGVWGRS